MNGYPSCKTCAAFFRSHPSAREGQCRARPPQPLLLGMAQAPGLPGIIGSRNGASPPQPVVNGFFPPTSENIWCMEWQPLADEITEEAMTGANA